MSNRRVKIAVATAQPQAKRVRPPKKWFQRRSRSCPTDRSKRNVLQERIVAMEVRDHLVGSEDETFDGLVASADISYVTVVTPKEKERTFFLHFVPEDRLELVEGSEEDEIALLMEQPPGAGYDTESGLHGQFVDDLPAGFCIEYGGGAQIRRMQLRRMAQAAVVEPDWGDPEDWDRGRFELLHLPMRD